jgi:phage terminase small subunit
MQQKKPKTKNTMKKENTSEATLTPREERFCYEYILHLNATKAAINAQYSKKIAKRTGSRLLKKDNVRQRINYLKNNLAEIAGISALRILKEHEKIAFSNAGQLHNGWMTLKEFENLTPKQKAIIQEVTTRETKYGKEIKIKIYNKQKSLDSIKDILGYYAPKHTPITGKDLKDPVDDMTNEELDAQIVRLEQFLNLKR